METWAVARTRAEDGVTGTAFLVALRNGRVGVLTALQNVCDTIDSSPGWLTWRHRHGIQGTMGLEFEGTVDGPISLQGTPLGDEGDTLFGRTEDDFYSHERRTHSLEDDWILLRLLDAEGRQFDNAETVLRRIGLRSLTPLASMVRRALFHARGFNGDVGTTYSGIIEEPNGRVFDRSERAAIQLRRDTPLPTPGLSGAPVVIMDSGFRERIVGLVRIASRPGASAARVVYATRMSDILRDCKLLADANVHIPEQFGLPNDRAATEPKTEFPGLKPVSDPGMLLGREREIAQVGRWMLDPGGPQIAFVHGRSGAGKSSFLVAGVAPRLKSIGHAKVIVSLACAPDPLLCLKQELETVLELDSLAQRGPDAAHPQAAERPPVPTSPHTVGTTVGDVARAWVTAESRGMALTLVVDQAGRSLRAESDFEELAELAKSRRDQGHSGGGRLLVSFSDEFLLRARTEFGRRGIAVEEVALSGLDVAHVVAGLPAELSAAGFPEKVRRVLESTSGQLGPVLQILLQNAFEQLQRHDGPGGKLPGAKDVWQSAFAEDSAGNVLARFVCDQLGNATDKTNSVNTAHKKELASGAAAVTRGMAYEVVSCHVDAYFRRAAECSKDSIRGKFPKNPEGAERLRQELVAARVLTEASSGSTTLIHDAIAQPFLALYASSKEPEQRAVRALTRYRDQMGVTAKESRLIRRLSGATLPTIPRDVGKHLGEVVWAANRTWVIGVITATSVLAVLGWLFWRSQIVARREKAARAYAQAQTYWDRPADALRWASRAAELADGDSETTRAYADAALRWYFDAAGEDGAPERSIGAPVQWDPKRGEHFSADEVTPSVWRIVHEGVQVTELQGTYLEFVRGTDVAIVRTGAQVTYYDCKASKERSGKFSSMAEAKVVVAILRQATQLSWLEERGAELVGTVTVDSLAVDLQGSLSLGGQSVRLPAPLELDPWQVYAVSASSQWIAAVNTQSGKDGLDEVTVYSLRDGMPMRRFWERIDRQTDQGNRSYCRVEERGQTLACCPPWVNGATEGCSRWFVESSADLIAGDWIGDLPKLLDGQFLCDEGICDDEGWKRGGRLRAEFLAEAGKTTHPLMSRIVRLESQSSRSGESPRR